MLGSATGAAGGGEAKLTAGIGVLGEDPCLRHALPFPLLAIEASTNPSPVASPVGPMDGARLEGEGS